MRWRPGWGRGCPMRGMCTCLDADDGSGSGSETRTPKPWRRRGCVHVLRILSFPPLISLLPSFLLFSLHLPATLPPPSPLLFHVPFLLPLLLIHSLLSIHPHSLLSLSTPTHSSFLPQRKREKAIEEGWEYARLAHLTYHISEHRLDFARRRRWVRKLINVKPGERAVFK